MKNKIFDKPTPLSPENPLSQNLIISKLAGFMTERELSRLSQTCKSLYNKIHYPLKGVECSIFQQQNYLLPYQPLFSKEPAKIPNNLPKNTLLDDKLLIIDGYIISAGIRDIKVVNPQTKETVILNSERNQVLAASSEGKLLCANAEQIQCWDLQKKTCINYSNVEKNVFSTGLLPLENEYFLSLFKNGTIKLYNTQSSACKKPVMLEKLENKEVCDPVFFSKNTLALLVRKQDESHCSEVRIYNFITGKLINRFRQEYIRAIACSTSDSTIAIRYNEKCYNESGLTVPDKHKLKIWTTTHNTAIDVKLDNHYYWKYLAAAKESGFMCIGTRRIKGFMYFMDFTLFHVSAENPSIMREIDSLKIDMEDHCYHANFCVMPNRDIGMMFDEIGGHEISRTTFYSFDLNKKSLENTKEESIKKSHCICF